MISQEEFWSENDLIAKAIHFAAEKHGSVINKDGSIGQKRKGSPLPYIVHPLEVWQILRNENCSVSVQAAGLLHDTLEDTDTSAEEIELNFGKEILALVQLESEDKTKSWKERKQQTLDHLNEIKNRILNNKNPDSKDLEVFYIICADKLSNCRAQLYDFRHIGSALFEKFNKESTPELQGWYYKGIVKALSPLDGMKMYQEFSQVVKELYGE